VDSALDLKDPTLLALRAALPLAVWEERVADARAHLAIVEAVEAARGTGLGEMPAIRAVAGGLHRSTYRNWLRKYLAQGFEGLISHIQPPPPAETKATPEVSRVICAMRMLDPHVAVERIADVLVRQFGTTLSVAVIKRVLKTAKLNRPPGGGVGRPEQSTPPPVVEEVTFAGAILLHVADEVTRYSHRLAEAMHEHAVAVAADAPEPVPRPEAEDARDEVGRFTATFNLPNAKGDAAQGPAFRSIEQKRAEVDLRARRLVGEGVGTIARKNRALLVLPMLTDTGKTVQVDDYRANRGLAEACGVGYAGETLERFLRDAKYLGLAEPLMEAHAGHWLELEPKPTTDDGPAGLCIYVDGSNKPLWTHQFTKSGKVTSNGRIMPCLEQVLVHTGMGTPIYWKTFSGTASLVTQVLPLLAQVEARVGGGWQADRIVVMDGGANSVGLFRQFDAAKREFITILKPSRVPDPADVSDLTPWAAYREGDEVAEGRLTLRDSKDGAAYNARVVLVRRRRAGQTTALVTNVSSDDLPTAAVADAYYARWPRQELRFKEFNHVANFKRVAGYGKQLVTNVVVVTELDKLKAQRARLATRMVKQGEAIKAARTELTSVRQAANVAKTRSKRQDGLVAQALLADKPDPNVVWDRVDVVMAERDRQTATATAVEAAEAAHLAAKAKLAESEAKLPVIAEREALLETRREIYQADTEMDRIMTVYKLGFVLLCEFVLREYFAGMTISLAGFMRQILNLPGTRTVDGYQEYVRLACPPNKDTRDALADACKRVTDLKLRRNGLVLHMAVEAGPGDPKQRSSRKS